MTIEQKTRKEMYLKLAKELEECECDCKDANGRPFTFEMREAMDYDDDMHEKGCIWAWARPWIVRWEAQARAIELESTTPKSAMDRVLGWNPPA